MFIYISNGIAPFFELGLCYQIVHYTMVGGMGQIGEFYGSDSLTEYQFWHVKTCKTY